MSYVTVPVSLLDAILESVHAVEGELFVEHSKSLANINDMVLSLIPDKEGRLAFKDQVAIAVVVGLMAHPNHTNMTEQFVAGKAYSMALALEKAREKWQGDL